MLASIRRHIRQYRDYREGVKRGIITETVAEGQTVMFIEPHAEQRYIDAAHSYKDREYIGAMALGSLKGFLVFLSIFIIFKILGY